MCFSVIFVPLIQQKCVSVKDIYYSIPKLNWKISPPYWYTEQFVFQSFFRMLTVAQVIFYLRKYANGSARHAILMQMVIQKCVNAA